MFLNKRESELQQAEERLKMKLEDNAKVKTKMRYAIALEVCIFAITYMLLCVLPRYLGILIVNPDYLNLIQIIDLVQLGTIVGSMIYMVVVAGYNVWIDGEW